MKKTAKPTFKKNDVVKIKSKAWYNAKKNKHGFAETGICGFSIEMVDWCSQSMTIKKVIKDEDGSVYYKMVEDQGKFCWDENMFM